MPEIWQLIECFNQYLEADAKTRKFGRPVLKNIFAFCHNSLQNSRTINKRSELCELPVEGG
jgi:hypothetical protein